MKIYRILFYILFLSLTFNKSKGQIQINTISLVSSENLSTMFCFNNSKLMKGNSISDRYLVYYNSDTIFLNVKQSGTWTKKVVYTGSNLSSATISYNNDTIWVCWQELINIRARFSPDLGDSWSDIIEIAGFSRVGSPSIFAAENGKVHFAWHKQGSGDTAIYYRYYFNGSLSDTIRLSNVMKQGLAPSLIAIGDTVLCTWKENPLPSQVWFRRSFNGGNIWDPSFSQPTNLISLTKDPNLAHAFDSTLNKHYVYLAYDGKNMIYLQRTTNFGDSWSHPDTISNLHKLSQFAHIDCNDNGFVGLSYEQRPIGTSLFDDSKKDVGFTYSTNWGEPESFSVDTLAYTHNSLGSVYPAINKIDDNNFFLTWLTRDTLNNIAKVLERRIHITGTLGINTQTQNVSQTINLFPNPISTQMQLHMDNPLKNATVTVYNILGQQVMEYKNINGSYVMLKTNNLTNGIYFVRILQSSEIIAVRKVVVKY